MKINPNYPAFPSNALNIPINDSENPKYAGIPIRLQIAAMMAQGHCANATMSTFDSDRIAKISLEQADALIAAYNASTP